MDEDEQITIEINAEIENDEDLRYLAFQTLGDEITNLVGSPKRGKLSQSVQITGKLSIKQGDD